MSDFNKILHQECNIELQTNSEADLGMCGLCGRTGAPTKRGPPHEDKHKFFIAANLLQHANCCHEMPDFKAKMHQIAFGGRAPPGPAGGAWALPQTP